MPGAPLSLPEREEIRLALTEDPGVSWTSISRLVGRHRTTIAREVAVHGGRLKYRPAVAERTALRCRKRPRDRFGNVPAVLRDRLVVELRQGRSPEAIWADLRAEDAPVVPCVETIYQAVYCGGRRTRNRRAGLQRDAPRGWHHGVAACCAVTSTA